uniref:Uncharacterized protein n=1 Tax=Cacopsylla melanoneura TaxID=428564 RepID=A0A8D8ZVT4_9HEMI
MLKLTCLLCACVVTLSAQDPNDATQPTLETVKINVNNTGNGPANITNTSGAVSDVNGAVNDVNGTLTDNTLLGNQTSVEIDETNKTNASGTVDIAIAQTEANKVDEINAVPTTAGGGNDTLIDKVENVVKRLFKRDIVGSLVSRMTYELVDKKPKITIPPFMQAEYYKLKQRKNEIELNKKIWQGKNLTHYEDLIQNTWEKLVNWSQDHIRFEDKIIEIHKLKNRDNIQRTKELDSMDEPDSEDKMRSVDSAENSKSMGPEYATVKNVDEVREKYLIEHEIAELEKKMKNKPKQEDNEKSRLVLKELKHELSQIQLKYDRIRALKLSRQLAEDIWTDKGMIDKKKDGKDSDESEKKEG